MLAIAKVVLPNVLILCDQLLKLYVCDDVHGSTIHAFLSSSLLLTLQDHPYHGDPLSWKRKLFAAEDRLEMMHTNFVNACKREKRAKQSVNTYLKQLSDKNLINDELHLKLSGLGGIK